MKTRRSDTKQAVMTPGFNIWLRTQSASTSAHPTLMSGMRYMLNLGSSMGCAQAHISKYVATRNVIETTGNVRV